MEPLTVRILSRNRDVYLDLAGGNRIPKISERQARTVAELRSAGVGVSHAMLVHFDTPESSDLFKAVLTMLDPQVSLTLVPVALRGKRRRPSGNGLSRTSNGPSSCGEKWPWSSCPRGNPLPRLCGWPRSRAAT